MGNTANAFLVGAIGGGALLTLAQAVRTREYFVKASAAVLLAEILVWGIWRTLVYPHFVSPLRHLPQPEGNHWLLGHGLKILREPNGFPARAWTDTVPHEGLIRYLWLFNQERVLVASPKALAEVLSTDNYSYIRPPRVSRALGRLLGYGVLLAEGEEHKVQRRNLMPAFSFRHVKNLYPDFWSKSREVVEAMTAQCEGRDETPMNVMNWSSRCTLDIIGLAGMGRDFGSVQDKDAPLARTYQSVFRPSKQRQILALLGEILPAWITDHIPLQRNADVAAAVREIRAVSRDLIRDKKARLAAGGDDAEPETDILSVALQSGLFSDDKLVDQLMTFLAAGHDTTASALTWAIYALCRFPNMQSRLRDEVRERLPPIDDDVAAVSSQDIDGMPYLQAVCSEVLRYYSPVPQTGREAARDTSILGHPIPRGTRIMMVPWAVNKDAALWGPSAGEFDPERWLAPADGGAKGAGGSAASGGASSNYANLTFLHGPRSCIGQSFARAELACLLAAWVGRFEFALQDERMMDERNVDIKSGVTSRPTNGVPVRVRVVEGY